MRLLALAIALLAGCAGRIDSTVLSEDLWPVVPLWEREAARRFKDAHLIFCHGWDWGAWGMRPTPPAPAMNVAQVAWLMSEVEKGRTVVLIVCNPQGRTLHGPPNVLYAKSDVWQVPDSDVAFWENMWRELKKGPGTGSIWEFERARPPAT